MFTIMENRKRPRLELINTNNNSTDSQGVASSASSMGSATLATIGGQSFILSNNSASSLPANILLSICDDNSDESEEYIIDSSVLAQIKQENTVATQTSSTQQQQPTLVATVPQYRIINQSGKILNNSSLNSSSVVNTPVSTNSSIISNRVHLPPGCEYYVIKEVVNSPKQVIAESTSPKQLGNTTIKIEPMSPLPAPVAGSIQFVRNSSISSNTTQNINSSPNISSLSIKSSSPGANNSPPDDTAKRSLILEAYKKRDDKRRATHNEVERRRRDKINSWIFKLKEMLPSEVMPSNSVSNKESSSCATQPAVNQNTSTRLLVQQGTVRTPPSDSKSQILIKACEYIKSMQEEIESLRECLTENENLRLSNQSLQEEINNLRSKQQQQQNLHNNNNNNILLNTNNNNDDCEITLNSLNATYANVQLFTTSSNNANLAGLVGVTTNSNNTTTPKLNVTYAKRELIIRDYVD